MVKSSLLWHSRKGAAPPKPVKNRPCVHACDARLSDRCSRKKRNIMRFGARFTFVLLVMFPVTAVAQKPAAPDIQVTQSSGGAATTDLGLGVIVNKGSTLQRQWVTIHDPSMPVDLF